MKTTAGPARSRPRLSQGLLISFEGSEGCGKSTHIRRLATRLRQLGYNVLVVREPGGTLISERIRHLLKFSKSNGNMVAETELMLFAASRTQLVHEKILPALRREMIVLCDRFVDSTTVYQGFARKLDIGFIAKLNRFVTTGCKPDLTLVLEVNPETGLARARQKTKTTDRMEAQRLPFYRAVSRGYHLLAKREPRRVKQIDASRTVAETTMTIWKLVKSYIQR